MRAGYCTSAQWWAARAHDPRIQEALDRQRRIAEMRASGATFREIGEAFQITPKNARNLHAKHAKRRSAPIADCN